MKKILTVTLNPSLDEYIRTRQITKGKAHKVLSKEIDIGGKGINVSRVVSILGGKTIAMSFKGGKGGHFLEQQLKEEKIQTHLIKVKGETRVVLYLEDLEDNSKTVFKESGPFITYENLQGFIKLYRKILSEDLDIEFVSFGGSIPDGISEDIYFKLIRIAKELSKKVFLDTHDKPLELALKAEPDFIKPNRYEAQRLLGTKVSSKEEVIKAIETFISLGAKNVIISLDKEGAITKYDGKYYRIIPPLVEVKSAIGAGDSLIGGFLFSLLEGKSYLDSLKFATAVASSTVETEGTNLCRVEDLDRLQKDVSIFEVSVD